MGSSQVQGRLWGASPADWAQLTEPAMEPVYEAVFDALEVRPGVRLFDAGCGAGLALQLAAKRGAVVSGLDAAAGLLAIARERVPADDLREGELEELPYPDGSFDAVTAFNSVQYASDPVAALRELRRVAVPGAPVAIVTWAPAERCETRVVLAAIGALLPPPPPGAGGPFALSAPGKLEELASAAGLTRSRPTRYRPRSATPTSTPRCAHTWPPGRRGGPLNTPASRRSPLRCGPRWPAAAARTAATGRTTRFATWSPPRSR